MQAHYANIYAIKSHVNCRATDIPLHGLYIPPSNELIISFNPEVLWPHLNLPTT